jgi:hypothetical protein
VATDPTATAAALADAAHGEEYDSGLNVLSEEQTNAALEALQESSTIVEVASTGNDTPAASTKRKAHTAEPSGAAPKKAKQRRTPTRVSWDDRMAMLQAYQTEHGDLLIPIRYKLNPSLGKFVHNTREQYKLYHKKTPEGYKKKCSLTAERIQQLDDLGFVWSTERSKRQEEDWTTRLEQLQAYKKKHGDCLVPHGYVEDPSFAEWIHRQRTTYASMLKDDKPNVMVKERMEKLEEMGFNFTVHSDKWTDHWKLLQEYKEKHGHCQVPTHYAENPKLGRWVHTQRHQRRLQLKGKKNCMTQERVDLLDKLKFSWEVKPSLDRPRATWQQRFDELRAFHKAHGHFRIPAGDQPQLHSWCQEQKQRLKNIDKNKGKDGSKRMGPDRVEALLNLGFTGATELVQPDAADKDGATAVSDADGTTNTEKATIQVKEESPGEPSGEPVGDPPGDKSIHEKEAAEDSAEENHLETTV